MFLKKIFQTLSRKEKFLLAGSILIFLASASFWFILFLSQRIQFAPKAGGQFREGVIGQPIFVNPLISANERDRDLASLLFGNLWDLKDECQTEDNATYLFKIKQGLVWDDNQPLTSDDILFTIKTIQDPNAQSPLFQSWQGVTVERISELQIRFILHSPYVFFPDNLKRLPILPQHIFGGIPAANLKLSNYNLEPIGNGPFKYENFSKRKDGFITQYQLVVNERYAGQKPWLKNFIFKFYENENSLLKAFEKREIDGFGGFDLQKINEVKADKNLYNISTADNYILFFNQNISPALKDKNIRLALTQTIDKSRIIKEIFRGAAARTDLFSNNNPLDETTIAGLREKNLEFNLIVPQIDFLIKTAEFVKEDWSEKLSAKTNLVVMNPQDIVEQVIRSRDYEIILFGINIQNLEDFFSFWHSSQKFYPGLNLSLYDNIQADQLMEEIRQTNETEIRKTKLETLQTLIGADQPVVFLYSPQYFYVSAKKLGGFGEKFLRTANDRFQNIENWYVKRKWIFR